VKKPRRPDLSRRPQTSPSTDAPQSHASATTEDEAFRGLWRQTAGYTEPKPEPTEEGVVSKEEATGRMKEAAGDLTGDKGLQREGETEQVEGKAKDAVDSTADKVKDAVNKD
jgi:uncharacterized protein YjbJ (UPF0337 family)